LISHPDRMVVGEKLIEDDLSWVEESATKSRYKLGVGFEGCEGMGGKSAPKFIPRSSYYKEVEAIKSTKAHYPSNPKPSFNPKRDVKKESPKLREEASVWMFCGCASHLDEFCFHHK
jgi:Fe-S oxidoreductase